MVSLRNFLLRSAWWLMSLACFSCALSGHNGNNLKRILQDVNNNCVDATEIFVPYFSGEWLSTAGLALDGTHRSDTFQCASGLPMGKHLDDDIPRRFFKVAGNGGFITAKLCSKMPAMPWMFADSFVRKLYLFEGSCGPIGESLECLSFSDTELTPRCPGVIWQSEVGKDYILAAESNGEQGALVYLELLSNDRYELAPEISMPFESGLTTTDHAREAIAGMKQLYYVVNGTGNFIVAQVCNITDSFDGPTVQRTLEIYRGDVRESRDVVSRSTSVGTATSRGFPVGCQGLRWESSLGQIYSIVAGTRTTPTGLINLIMEEDFTTIIPTVRPTPIPTERPASIPTEVSTSIPVLATGVPVPTNTASSVGNNGTSTASLLSSANIDWIIALAFSYSTLAIVNW